MKKILLFLCVSILIIYSCKKDDSMKAQYAKLIIGTWKSTSQNTKIYTLTTDELLKDTTVNFTGHNASRAWLEIYNKDGSGYVTSLPANNQNAQGQEADTTAFLTYTILGSNLTIKQTNGGSATKPILALNNTDMDLQSTSTGNAPANWGLNTKTLYKITLSTHYTKQ